MNIERENQPRERNCVEVHVAGARFCRVHRGSGLWKEILNDDFLDVTMSTMRCSDCFKGSDAIVTVLSDPNEDACREWNCEFACSFKGCEATLWSFVRRTAVTFKIVS